MAYIDVPFADGFETLLARALDRVRENIPGWVPQEGHLDVAILEEATRQVVEARAVAAQVPESIFSVYGQSIVGIEQVEGSPAAGTARFTVINDSGYNIPQGTVVAWAVTGDERVYFTTDATLTIAAGNLTGDVGVTAEESGAHGNGLGPGQLIVVDQLTVVDSAELLAETSGGVDAESDEAYRDRLSSELQLQSPRPILPADFEVLARRVAGVHRALSLDGYDPSYNRLTANQASLETDTAGWNAGANTAIARDTSQAAEGTASLRLDDTTSDAAAGDISAYTDGGLNGVEVEAGRDYTALASARDSGTVRDVFATVDFYDDAGTLLASVDGTAVSQTSGVWTQASATAEAPAGAAFARLRVTVVGVADGESHFVDRAAIHQGTDPSWFPGGTGGFDNPRTITLVPVDGDGKPVGQAVADQLVGDLDAQREVNFVVHADEPVYTSVVVDFTVRREDGASSSDVNDRAEAAVREWLSPAYWGGGDESPAVWRKRDTVRYLEAASVLSGVEGVDFVETLTLNGAEQDVTLQGVAPLPAPFDDPDDPSAVTGSVAA